MELKVINTDLKAELLDSAAGLINSPVDLNACLNSHGLYNPFQFVLRLSPEVHRRIAALPIGIVRGIDFDGLQAFSTYLHETIHWWQHVGSTSGLMLSLSYPGQAHANYTHLKNLIARIGPKKSILRFVEKAKGPGAGPDTANGLANIILNNHFDIEFFRILATNPGLTSEIAEHPLFDCVGHSYAIAYANIILILAATLDDNFRALPDPRGWQDEFVALRSVRHKGFYWGSSISISPVGARQIFEGHARFAQLQFLHFASGGKLGWDDVQSRGMLEGIYGEAFEHFLRLADLAWPPSIDHPVVALFLLVCDIAMNPGAGFPMPLQVFTTFIEDTDPGYRFLFLCRTIAKQRPDLAGSITHYSRAEYAEVSEALTRPLLVDSPLAIAEAVTRWVACSETFNSLTTEHQTYDYAPTNLPVRLLFSHFLAFSEDKYSKPEFFCWPGAWMTGERLSPEIATLFDRHSAPFVDKPEDGGIYPRLIPGKNVRSVQKTFDIFYAANVTYDLTRQWIAKAGPFEYDYRWLSSSGSHADMKGFADRHFEKAFGFHPDNFDLL